LTMSLLLVLVSCGQADPVKNVDLAQLAEKLLAEAEFTDAMASIDAGTVTMLYGIDNAKEQQVYVGSGATPEEIALFSFTTEEDAEAGLELAKMRLQDQADAFADYNNWEMPKLDNAVVKRYGTYVVLCVSAGNEAEGILEETFGK